MGFHSQSLLFFIVDTSCSCVICSKFFWILCYENCTLITEVLVDRPLNFKTVNVQYKMCYKDFKYNIYIVTLVKLVKWWNYKIVAWMYASC